jgi:uncharacterized OsmC-like protein
LEYSVLARSTDTIGRVLASCRDQHLVVDVSSANGGPGEAMNPGELFLSGIATCGVELLQVTARARGIGLTRVTSYVRGFIDRSNPVRSDLSVPNAVHVHFELEGLRDEEASFLVEAFKRR